MSDDLRTRIAAVLYKRFAPQLGMADEQWENEHPISQELWRDDADAVIAELGLVIDYADFRTSPVYRYVTEWQPNE